MKDYATALRELKPLAEQGNATAQYYVGAMYAFGNGVHKDHIFALMWANIALANGNHTGTRLINFVEKKMTPSEIETAQDLTRECVRKKYEGCGEVKFEDLVKKNQAYWG
jgi:TPR repeat protein